MHRRFSPRDPVTTGIDSACPQSYPPDASAIGQAASRLVH